MKLRLLFIFICFSFAEITLAQVLDHKLGEYLVKVESPKQIQNLSQKYNQSRSSKSSLSVKQSLAGDMNIYLLSIDYRNIDEYAFLEELKRDENVLVAQFNHILDYRNTPNDALFTQQWQYIGSNGGVDGIDIDADLAWDITTGGTTVFGDTIVVCIIDGGVDLYHEEFQHNLWVNRNEIPNDGIDNDGNGYIDDVRGWDVDANNDDVHGSTHGTSVAGIVGAEGNNGIGVAGVNWNVKMMIVRGGGDEAAALAAYAYPYAMRKLYNETNGEKGAFVVATNASWGTDMGKAVDAPLWCSFYDSLGVVGVLNCGATANENYNVDVVGDLPTQCSSDYLIAVTNITMDDVKVISAGYGKESVDLGAFGEGTFTVRQNNKYGTFGGTSGATPHVAGAIALLYSAPCADFMDMVKANPALAASTMKSYILDGVDHNESLEGITTTEGRLNINNSLQLMLNQCGDCLFPYGLDAKMISMHQAELSWDTHGDDLLSLDLEWKKEGVSDWNLVNGVTSPYILEEVDFCSNYEFRLRSVCSTITSDFSPIANFSTELLPDALTLVDNSENEFEVSWNNPKIITNPFELQLLEKGEIVMSIPSSELASSYRFKNVKSCTKYQVRLVTSCDSNPLMTTIETRTKGCGYCLDTEYCKPVSSSKEEWIDSLKVGDVMIPSGNNNGYIFNTDVSFDFEKGQTIPIVLYPGFNEGEYSDKVAIWLDTNRDGVFNNADYVSQSEYTKDSGQVVVNLDIPEDMESGSTRMRVIFSFNVSERGCDDFDYGEVEDYCVNIQDCFFDTHSLAIDTYTEKAILTWVNSSNTPVTVRYREAGASNWEGQTVTMDSIQLDSLKKCTNYDVQFEVTCSEGRTPYFFSVSFKTKCKNSTSSLAEFSEMNLHPNPVSDVVALDFMSSVSVPCTWTIYNLQGKAMKMSDYKILQGKNTLTIPLDGNIASGIYFLQIKNAAFSKTMKFIKL